MALTAQQTFVDRLSSAEGGLTELASYAEHLANRLVGYANEVSGENCAEPPSNGLLQNVGDTADRMSRTVSDIRANLNRIAQSLPPETGTATVSKDRDGWLK